MSLFLLTGERAAGKTTFCETLYSAAREKKWNTAGILTLTERQTGLHALDLSSGEIRLLASPTPQEAGPEQDSGLHTQRWAFDPRVLEWGNRVLKQSGPADLFILDEAGILEFQRNRGWTEGMTRVDGRIDRIALVVVRPELTGAALKRWPAAEVLSIDPARRPEEESLRERVLHSIRPG